jgi:signal transduction histidine kinase
MLEMDDSPVDPRWPRLLGLAVHEFRTPITVVAGYIRMLLKERAGAITDQQRKLLEEAEKSCGRLSGLVSEMSDLSSLEAGSTALNKTELDLRQLITEAISALPALPDREVAVELDAEDGPITITADATRLKTALASVCMALRREVVTSDRLIVKLVRKDSHALLAITVPEHVDDLCAARPSDLTIFDEWRGGSGLTLAIARRIIGQHAGSLYGDPNDGKASAVVRLPIT